MYSSLGVVDPFDSNCSLISSSLYNPRILAIQRLVLGIYGCATIIFSLFYESIALRQGNMYDFIFPLFHPTNTQPRPDGFLTSLISPSQDSLRI
jgi:hypothetical protein